MGVAIMSAYVIDMGAVAVGLHAAHPELVEYLSGFYELNVASTGHGELVDWQLRVRLGEPPVGMPRTPWGVGLAADPTTRQAVVVGSDPAHLAITVRKMAREALVEFCGARAATMLHASAVTDGRRVVIIVGDKGAGKTTLALSAVLDRGWSLLSNDHLLIYRDDARDHVGTRSGLIITSLPTPIPVKTGTWRDWSQRLPEPWAVEGTTLAQAQELPTAAVHAAPGRFLYTYRGLGQVNPRHVALADLTVDVVLARYATTPDQAQPTTPERPEPAETVALLDRHVRRDWWFGTANTHYLPRAERSPDVFLADSRARLAELTTIATTVRWAHHGDLGPLLTDPTLADQMEQR